MDWISVDVESDNSSPANGSMIAIGAVAVHDFSKTFHGLLKPRMSEYNPDALAVSKFTREQTMAFDDPYKVMKEFKEWLSQFEKPAFLSDNNGFDWQWINFYFDLFNIKNPFGHSSRNLSDIFKGMKRDYRANFKYLRKTQHDHNPVNDAKGNAEAFLAIMNMGFRA